MPSKGKIIKFAVFTGMVAAAVAIIWRIRPVRRLVTGEVPIATAAQPSYWVGST